MFEARTVTLADLLLLFIYMEVLAMVAMYLDTGKLPVRMPLYIAIVALARYMILDMKSLDTLRMLGVAGGRSCSWRWPSSFSGMVMPCFLTAKRITADRLPRPEGFTVSGGARC